jgi:molecular chaperone GrpE
VIFAYSAVRALPLVFVREFHGSILVLWSIDVLTALLPALDDIDRIREHSEMDDSFKAVANKIDKAFEKFGVEKFGEKGEDFDPTKHDAILHKPDPNAEKETVDTVVEAGYRIGDRVIRAARVVVASPQN